MKTCRVCQKTLPISCFYRRDSGMGRARSDCRECVKQKTKDWNSAHPNASIDRYDRHKREMIAVYGGRCVCCGEREPDFLSIDHVNNDGAKHRTEKSVRSIVTWLRKHNYPKEGFRILCYNCNLGRAFANEGGKCPHDTGIVAYGWCV